MIQPSLFDQNEPPGVQGVPRERHIPKTSPYTGARAYARVREFAETPNRTAPTTPCDDVPDPAAAYPTRASRKAAFDRWTAEGQPWPPPAGLTSAIASCLIPRRIIWELRKWR